MSLFHLYAVAIEALRITGFRIVLIYILLYI
nr:MAG TPA: hypothetical protein [Caudoviricetes sp.]